VVFVLSNTSLPNASRSPIESSAGALSTVVSVVARSTTTIVLP